MSARQPRRRYAGNHSIEPAVGNAIGLVLGIIGGLQLGAGIAESASPGY